MLFASPVSGAGGDSGLRINFYRVSAYRYQLVTKQFIFRSQPLRSSHNNSSPVIAPTSTVLRIRSNPSSHTYCFGCNWLIACPPFQETSDILSIAKVTFFPSLIDHTRSLISNRTKATIHYGSPPCVIICQRQSSIDTYQFFFYSPQKYSVQLILLLWSMVSILFRYVGFWRRYPLAPVSAAARYGFQAM
jgi:hypothetical protein